MRGPDDNVPGEDDRGGGMGLRPLRNHRASASKYPNAITRATAAGASRTSPHDWPEGTEGYTASSKGLGWGSGFLTSLPPHTFPTPSHFFLCQAPGQECGDERYRALKTAKALHGDSGSSYRAVDIAKGVRTADRKLQKYRRPTGTTREQRNSSRHGETSDKPKNAHLLAQDTSP